MCHNEISSSQWNLDEKVTMLKGSSFDYSWKLTTSWWRAKRILWNDEISSLNSIQEKFNFQAFYGHGWCSLKARSNWLRTLKYFFWIIRPWAEISTSQRNFQLLVISDFSTKFHLDTRINCPIYSYAWTHMCHDFVDISISITSSWNFS